MGDVIDKMTILTRKTYFGEEFAHIELDAYIKKLGKLGELLVNTIRLGQINFEIWNLENELRKGGEDKFSLEEIGRRAIKIRDFNKKRIQYKNEINRITQTGFIEYKIKHRSQ